MENFSFTGGSTSHRRPHLWQEGESHINLTNTQTNKQTNKHTHTKNGRPHIYVCFDLIVLQFKVSVRVNAPPGGKSGAFWWASSLRPSQIAPSQFFVACFTQSLFFSLFHPTLHLIFLFHQAWLLLSFSPSLFSITFSLKLATSFQVMRFWWVMGAALGGDMRRVLQTRWPFMNNHCHDCQQLCHHCHRCHYQHLQKMWWYYKKGDFSWIMIIESPVLSSCCHYLYII